ncbi:hypothetical protein IV102_03285 [bacterium]|nr:hypothetical protein [bacterium]
MRRLLSVLVMMAALLAPARADRTQIGPQDWVAGVPAKDFVHFAAAEGQGRQRMQNWCWAACIQMVLNYHGLYIKQEDIVAKVFGSAVDAPAGPQMIMAALQGWAPDTRGRMSQIEADSRNLEPASVIQDLEYRWPLIVGLTGAAGQTGHAYVLTAAYYRLDQYGQPVIYRVVLRDPYPTKTSRVEMGMDEFMARCSFATRVHVRRL